MNDQFRYREVSAFFAHRLNCFERSYSLALQELNLDNIHDLRVSIKKVRSLLSLLELASNKKFDPNESFHLLNPVFKNAGYIRECQINICLLEQFDNKVGVLFRDHLIKKQTKSAKKLIREMNNFDIDELKRRYELTRKYIFELPITQINQASVESVEDKIQKIKRLKQKASGKFWMHKIRKHLKYVLEILDLINSLVEDHELKPLSQKTKSCAKLIGEWHDYQVFLASFKRFLFIKKINNKASKAISATIQEKTEELMRDIDYHLDLMLDASKL